MNEFCNTHKSYANGSLYNYKQEQPEREKENQCILGHGELAMSKFRGGGMVNIDGAKRSG